MRFEDRRYAFTIKHPFHSSRADRVAAWYRENAQRSERAMRGLIPTIEAGEYETKIRRARHAEILCVARDIQRKRFIEACRRAERLEYERNERARLRTIANKRRALFEAVNEVSGITPEELRSEIRSAHVVRWRRIMIAIAHRQICVSTTRLGEWLNRDHTTIVHSLKRHRTDCAEADRADLEAVQEAYYRLCNQSHEGAGTGNRSQQEGHRAYGA